MAAVKLTASIVEKFIPPRAQNSRKGDNGKILILGGSYVYHGAPILASLAALRCGTDLVYTAVPKINSQATRAASPNLIVIPLADQKLTRGAAKKLLGQTPVGLDSAAIGMGLAVQERNSLLLLIKTLLDSDVRLLLDASALGTACPKSLVVYSLTRVENIQFLPDIFGTLLELVLMHQVIVEHQSLAVFLSAAVKSYALVLQVPFQLQLSQVLQEFAREVFLQHLESVFDQQVELR